MPELPEVEVLVRHLAPQLRRRTIRALKLARPKTLKPTTPEVFKKVLIGAKFLQLSRRGKYLLFTLRPAGRGRPITVVGHLGMTGRMYLQPAGSPLPRHAAVVLDLGDKNFVFEDTRYFGRFTLDTEPIARLGPEPMDGEFAVEHFGQALKRSAQAIKVKLLDQSLVAGIGNIYASEALFRARISPRTAARRLQAVQVKRLWKAIRETLAEAIRCGSTVPLDYAGTGRGDGLFYFGSSREGSGSYEERLRVYDRHGRPCGRCGTTIKRFVQGARSTFYCPNCQRA